MPCGSCGDEPGGSDPALSSIDADGAAECSARALELRQLLDRFADVCHTVAYAHSRGVLHRDLKPANIMLGPFNESLVVDWGLAKVFGHSPRLRLDRCRRAAGDLVEPDPRRYRVDDPIPAGDSAAGHDSGIVGSDDRRRLGSRARPIRQAGTAFGTPAFMSPEQAEGRVDQLGPASDVYSLGAVLYTLLCGKTPFEYRLVRRDGHDRPRQAG